MHPEAAGEGIPTALFDCVTQAIKGARSALGQQSSQAVVEPESKEDLDDFQTKITPWDESLVTSREEQHKAKKRQQLIVVASCIDKATTA